MSLWLVHRLEWAWAFLSSDTVFGHPVFHLALPQFSSQLWFPGVPFFLVFRLVSQSVRHGLACCIAVQYRGHSQAMPRDKRETISWRSSSHSLGHWSCFLDFSGQRDVSFSDGFKYPATGADRAASWLGLPWGWGWNRNENKQTNKKVEILFTIYLQLREVVWSRFCLEKQNFPSNFIVYIYLKYQVKARR